VSVPAESTPGEGTGNGNRSSKRPTLSFYADLVLSPILRFCNLLLKKQAAVEVFNLNRRPPSRHHLKDSG
jgi:hypothetical protein